MATYEYVEDMRKVRELGIDWQSYCVLQMLSHHTFDSEEQCNTVAEFLINIASSVEDAPEDVVSLFWSGITYGKYTIDDLDTEDGYMKVESYIYERL